MANNTEKPIGALLGEEHDRRQDSVVPPPMEPADDGPSEHDIRLTRRVHVSLGLVVAAAAAWMLYRSATELPFQGGNNEPGPGYLPVLLTICLIGLGLALAGAWLFGPRARSGEVPTTSLVLPQMSRAMLVWLALVVCTALLEPLGFILAGEALVLLVIVVVERMRAIPQIIALLLLPPAMYFLFETLLEVQLPGGTLWY
jgi:hypothetical protein